MAIKDYVVPQRHYPKLYHDYKPLTTRKAIEHHNGSRG